jgi:hypothetical protein
MMCCMAETAFLPPPGHGLISKLTSDDGDFRITWDPADPEQVENARQAFADLRRERYAAYKVEGQRRTVIREFDPAAGAMHIVMHLANRGG